MSDIADQYYSFSLGSRSIVKVFVPFELSKRYSHDPHLQDYLYHKRDVNCSIDKTETCYPEEWGTKIGLDFKIVPKATQLFTDISAGGFSFRLMIIRRREETPQFVNIFNFPSCEVAGLKFYNHIGLFEVSLVTTA
jgi:hypothetical protein